MDNENLKNYSIKVTGDFSAGHFISEISEGLHGHNFKVVVSVSGNLNENFMVLDFREIGALLGKICDEMDHKIIVPEKSEDIEIKKQEGNIELVLPDRRYSFPEKDVALLPIESNTTELIVYYIHSQLKKKINGKIKVVVTEKENYSASFVG